MKAVVVSAIGAPETLVLQEMPDPTPGPGQILVKVRYSGINYAETLARRGVFPTPPVPFIMGLEIVGEVAALGAGVEGFTIGEPVAAFTQNGYAQYAAVPAALVVSLGERGHGIDPIKAIGVPCTGVTAHQLLTFVGKLQTGDTMFVQGAAGGVGSMLGQQAKALGAARVIGSVGSMAKSDFARTQGYDDVITYDGFADRLKELTGGRGVDLAFEGVSGNNLAGLTAFLAPLGRAVYFGDANFSSDTQIPIEQLRAGSWTISGYSLGRLCATAPQYWRPSAIAVLDMIATGAIKDSGITLLAPGEASKAHELLETRRAQGKLGLDWSVL